MSCSKSDVLFTGYYGHRNTGDDAFIEVTSWGAKKYWAKENCRFLCHKQDLPVTLEATKGYPLPIPKISPLQNYMLLRNAKYLISAGGSTLHSKSAARSVKMMAVSKKAKRGGLQVGAIGVSIGPFKSIQDEKAIVDYLMRLDFLAVRDQASYDIVSNLDLPYKAVNAFDLAALLPDVYRDLPAIKRGNSKKTIGVSVCPVESISDPSNVAKERERHTMLCELLRYVDKHADVHFKFLIFNGNERVGDQKVTSELVNDAKLRSFEVVPYNKETYRMWMEVKSCDLVIASRLHAAIFSCFAEVPFFLNEYHSKCTDFLKTVGHHEAYRLYNSEYDVRDKARQVVDIINGAEYTRPTEVLSSICKSKLNFSEVGIV